MRLFIMLVFLSSFLIGGCGKGRHQHLPVTAPRDLTFPSIPVIYTTNEQRVEFILNHYWDHFDFADTLSASTVELSERAYVDFVNALAQAPMSLVKTALGGLMSRAVNYRQMYAHFMQLSEKYLYSAASPLRNDEFYIVVLQHILSNDALTDTDKLRFEYQLKIALKNRVGEKAANFRFGSASGKPKTMYHIPAERMLLIFFHPDCESCKRVKALIAEKEIDKQVQVIWVNTEVDQHVEMLYDLKATPTLYLLDRDKKVILKDTSLEYLEQYLQAIRGETDAAINE